MFTMKALLVRYKWHMALILFLVMVEVGLVGGIGTWREFFWDAVQKKDLNRFLVYIAEFAGMALGICLISGYTTYLISLVSLRMRTDLTERAVTLKHDEIEGGEQRVQEDCFFYPLNAITLLTGLLRNALVFIIFVVIITVQVGPLYLIVPLVYTLIGTFVAAKIANPLIKLNYMMQVVEAKFRRSIFKAPRGSKITDMGYMEVWDTNKAFFAANKRLSYFQGFYNQVTVIVPYAILFPLYFSGIILFGVFMQVASSMNHVIDSLSYVINSFKEINNWLSCRKRLKEMGVIE